jgi:hypothetical protein
MAVVEDFSTQFQKRQSNTTSSQGPSRSIRISSRQLAPTAATLRPGLLASNSDITLWSAGLEKK